MFWRIQSFGWEHFVHRFNTDSGYSIISEKQAANSEFVGFWGKEKLLSWNQQVSVRVSCSIVYLPDCCVCEKIRKSLSTANRIINQTSTLVCQNLTL